MGEFYIKLNNIADVKEFVSIVSKCDFAIELACERYVVDAKSIMGIFSLDLANDIKLIAHVDSESDAFKNLQEILKAYIPKEGKAKKVEE